MRVNVSEKIRQRCASMRKADDNSVNVHKGVIARKKENEEVLNNTEEEQRRVNGDTVK